MSTVRLVLLWLLMAALPLQGIAAVSMLWCSPAAGGHAAHAGHGGDEHAAPGAHAHPAADDSAASSSQVHAHHGGGGTPADVGGDQVHACSLDGGCCSAAMVPVLPVLFAPSLPAADLAAPQVHVLMRASPRPDKPPRA